MGQHAAITAGLAQSSGSRIVAMDCDLQDPPEEIPRLWAAADQGYDIVFARRRSRRHSPFRRRAAWTYFKLMNVFLGTSITPTTRRRRRRLYVVDERVHDAAAAASRGDLEVAEREAP